MSRERMRKKNSRGSNDQVAESMQLSIAVSVGIPCLEQITFVR